MPDPFFTKECQEFFTDLRANNNRDWFISQKQRLERAVLEPARELIITVGEYLTPYFPGLVSDPRTDQGIYRLNRDLRFSKDKTPYKDHLSLLWWYGNEAGRIESPSFYFQIGPDGWLWAVGAYRFSQNALQRYRTAVADPQKGLVFEKIIQELLGLNLMIHQPHLAKPPKGFQAGERNFWLRFKGLYAWEESDCTTLPDELMDARAPEFLASVFLTGQDYFSWLSKIYD